MLQLKELERLTQLLVTFSSCSIWMLFTMSMTLSIAVMDDWTVMESRLKYEAPE